MRHLSLQAPSSPLTQLPSLSAPFCRPSAGLVVDRLLALLALCAGLVLALALLALAGLAGSMGCRGFFTDRESQFRILRVFLFLFDCDPLAT